MPLREELERAGNWLFRWRSYLPLLLIVPMLLAMQDPHFPGAKDARPDLWPLACMGISLCGLAIRAATVGHAPAGTSGRNTKGGQIAESLSTTGMYSLVRHPLYLGNFVIWIGVSMYAMIWWLSALVALIFWLYYERIMFAEEEFLRRKFGDAFLRWAQSTPAFLPKLRRWKPPELPFSLRSVLRREYPGLFGIIASFYLLEVYERLVVERQQTIEPLWTGIFLAGLLVFLVLRTLKRKTTLLTAAGR
jgi:protein-S-isoprenylcysteine O-methyltransferase Ste14